MNRTAFSTLLFSIICYHKGDRRCYTTLKMYCITPIFRVELIFAIFANFDFARNFPPAKIMEFREIFLPRNFPPREKKIIIVV